MTNDDLVGIFDQDGLLSHFVKNFEFRDEQLEMAKDVLYCRQNGVIGVIEAGTGVGKSFAYLVPALMSAFENPENRTVIATSTINLQMQLINKDLPILFNVFQKDCNYALAVGKKNYICFRRLSEAMNEVSLYENDYFSDEIKKYNQFANCSETGMNLDYPEQLNREIWYRICCDDDFCIGSKCSYFSKCFYFKAKRKVMDASIVVCNHHLLLIDSKNRAEKDMDYSQEALLPAFSHLVIDEAHNIEKNATEFFTKKYSVLEILKYMNLIYNSKNVSSMQISLLEDLCNYCSDNELCNKLIDKISFVRAKTETLNQILCRFISDNVPSDKLLLSKQDAMRYVSVFRECAVDVIACTSDLLNSLLSLISKAESVSDDNYKIDECRSYIDRIGCSIQVLKEFMAPERWTNDVHYIQVEQRNNSKNISKFAQLICAPLYVSNVLGESLFSKLDSVVCTSATMDLADNFSFWKSNVGLPVSNKKILNKKYDSPFDFKHRLMLLTPYDAPDYDNKNEDCYVNYVIETSYTAVASSGGGALLLFTSYKTLDSVYVNLSPRFDALGLSCFKQGDFNRALLLKKFKDDSNGVLFATDSFWEGIDVPGDALRLVIITKLPFRQPDEPIHKSRLNFLRLKGENPFMNLSLPDAIMKLKQGFGRLIRHTADRGVVLILDSRVVKKNYGEKMIQALPESYHPDSSISTVDQKIESFLFSN